MGTRRPPSIAINRSFELATWASVLYAADGAFWNAYPNARRFNGLCCTASLVAAMRYDLRHVEVLPMGHGGAHAPTFGRVGHVGHGGHSGFQGINLAAQFGATRIVLIGFDLGGQHWHGDHVGEDLTNAGQATLAEWAATLDDAATTYAARGVEIVNASDRSALRAYPHTAIEDALTELVAA